jgi:hypothetical protein
MDAQIKALILEHLQDVPMRDLNLIYAEIARRILLGEDALTVTLEIKRRYL